MRRLDYVIALLFNVITAFVLRKILHTLTAVKVINNRGTCTSNLTAIPRQPCIHAVTLTNTPARNDHFACTILWSRLDVYSIL